MTKRYRYDCTPALLSLGFDESEARRLVLASNRLHRWHELECGTDAGAIDRDEETGALRWYNNRSGTWGRYWGKDYEALAKAMTWPGDEGAPDDDGLRAGRSARLCALHPAAGRCARG